MLSEPSPDETRRQAHEDFVRRAALVNRREELDAATAEAFTAFRRAGIDAVLLKGAALAAALYTPGEARGYFDIDVWIAPTQTVAAGEVLTKLGYRNFSKLRGVDDVGGALHADVWLGAMVGFRSGFAGVIIDLHRRLDGCEAADDIVWQELSDDRGWVLVGGATVPTLGRPGMALSVALHVAQHGPADAKAVGDLTRAVDRWPLEIWTKAALLAEAVGGKQSFAAGLRLLPVGATLADRLGLGPAEHVLWNIANRNSRPRGTFHWEALVEADSVRGKVDILRRALVPPRAWIAWETRWATRSYAHLVLAYFLHVVRTPAWALRAIRYSRRRRSVLEATSSR